MTEIAPRDDILGWLETEHAERAAVRLAAQREVDARNAMAVAEGKKLEPMPQDPLIEPLWRAAREIRALREREAIFTKLLRERRHRTLPPLGY
jgi:hypothetical protein